jgi:trk system potassium uptake protein TrkA
LHIIIIGAGDVGFSLAKQLSYEKNDIFLIEKDSEKYTKAADGLDIQVFLGDGNSFRLLEKAGIKKADMLVAVTRSDETNLIAAIMAKRYGVAKTIARVRNREYLMPEAPINAQQFGIDLIIHPESEAAAGAAHLLQQSAATDIVEFSKGKIILIGIQLDQETPILRRPLHELAAEYADTPFRTIAIHRKDHTKIPGGNDIFMLNDRIFVIAAKENIPTLLKATGKENVNIQNVMILGGGQSGLLLAKELEEQYNVKIIESDEDKSHDLAERLKKTLVIKGDGRDLNLLALEGIVDMDAFISLTGDDETNIISCLMAKHLKVPKIIALINKTTYAPIIPTIGINAYISKQQLTVSGILKFIRKGEVISVKSIPGISAEAIEMNAKEGSRITQKDIKDMKIPKDAILGAVDTGESVYVPVGSSRINAGDKIVLFALPTAIHEVEKLFN